MEFPSAERFEEWFNLFEFWLQTKLVSWETGYQLLAILVALGLAFLFGVPARRKLREWRDLESLDPRIRRVARVAANTVIPAIWLLFQWLAVAAAVAMEEPSRLSTIVASLLTAWVAIRAITGFLTSPTVARLVAVVIWTIAALNIVELLGPLSRLLDEDAVRLGGLRVSALTVIKGLLTLGLLLWIATLFARFIDTRVRAVASLTPSVQELIIKLTKILLITVAVVAGLSAVGIDLTAFAVFSGAVGVGIGFGLQKVVGNFISGIILLLDRSIKPGDVIAVGETYGWINALNARFVSVITRDGTEHLIPNETLITERVENWSYTHKRVRLRIPVGVSYDADVHKAIELCTVAANDTKRILKNPPAACLLKGFGDSSVDLELRVWINDAHNGVSNVKSEVLLGIWDRFQEHGIEIPFPQRDLHIRSAEAVPVDLKAPAKRAPRGAATKKV